MRHLLNTLFVTFDDIYLSLDGENVLANRGKNVVARYPLHTLQGIVTFSHSGTSPALLGACSERSIDVVFCSQNGRFLARISGITGGNVLLRREQYRIADDPERSCMIARNMVFGKIHNARWSMERILRDHSMRIDTEEVQAAVMFLKGLLPQVLELTDLDVLRGVEGSAAKAYFGIFDEMILQNKDVFSFRGRSRRPPMDRVNALLSFAYALLASECASALESAGLDASVGFMHRDRPGRKSMALDLMEELRPYAADRFVLTLLNNRMVSKSDFEESSSGAVFLTDSGRRIFLRAWQEKKRTTISHPFLQEKIPWGLVPNIQALLLARFIRGDLDAYPPFLWK